MKAVKALLLIAILAIVAGCEPGPPADNSNIQTPPKPAPPGSPG